MSNDLVFFYRSKYWLPQIGYTYCDANGWILEDQSKPSGTIIDNLSNDEIMEQVRKYRNELLQVSDWTQLPDVDLTDSQVLAWKQYRKNLREFPEKIDIVNWTGPNWPIPPE